MFERDPTKVRLAVAAMRARKQAEQKGEGRCAQPTFSNVSARAGLIKVQVTCATTSAAISFCLVPSKGQGPARPGSWRTATLARAKAANSNSEEDDALEWAVLDGGTVSISKPGRHVLLARASATGKADSAMASSVWWLAPPYVSFYHMT